MEETKPIYASKTFWGGIVTIGSAIAGICGLTIDTEVQRELIEYGAIIGGAIGALISIWGRVKAQKKIG